MSIALFPRQILLHCVGWKTICYCRKAFDASFHYDSLFWKEGKIIFKHGRLHKEGELDASFDEAILSPFIDLKHRRIGGKLNLEKLKIIHQKKELRPVPHPPSPMLSLFTLELDTQIMNGEILLYDFLSEKNFCQHAFFDVAHHIFGKQTRGSIFLTIESSTPKLVTNFFNEGKQLTLETSFSSQSLPLLTHFVAYFFQNYLPDPVFQWEILQGQVNGSVEMELNEGAPLKIKGHVALEKVLGENSALKLLANIDHLKCDLDVNLKEISSIQGFLDLQGGSIALQEKTILWEGLGDIKDIHSNIFIKEGKVESSIIKGNFMGIEGKMILDWQAHDILMNIGFQSSSKQVNAFLPEKLQTSFVSAFPEDTFFVDAILKRSIDGLKLEGKITLVEEEKVPNAFFFGCYLGRESKIEQFLSEELHFSPSRSIEIFLRNLKKQFCLSKNLFGWVHAENLSLNKFVSPFLFPDISIELTGRATLKATFDDQYLVIFYEGEDFELTSPHYLFKIPEIKEHSEAKVTAVHYVDLNTWHHVGFLPVQNGHYWQKNYDFHLEDIQAVIHFDNQQISVNEIEAKGHDLALKGDIVLDIASFSDLDLKINITGIRGDVSDAQKFLSHFTHASFCQMPIQGNICEGDEPLFFHYRFEPNARLMEGRIQTKICINAIYPLFSLHEYHATIFYNCKAKELQICGGEGRLYWPKKEKDFVLCTPQIHFKNCPNYLLDFSLLLKDKDKAVTCLTLQGESQLQNEEKALLIYGTGKEEIEKIQIKILQKERKFKVPIAIYGDWSACTEGIFDLDHIQINNFQCSFQEKATINFTGSYDFQTQYFQGEISNMSCDLTGLRAFFDPSFSSWKPAGEVEGKGKFLWSLKNGIEAETLLNFHNLEFGGIDFGSGEELYCKYAENLGFSIEGLEVKVQQKSDVEKYKLGRFHYDIYNQKILFEGFDFSLPPEKFPWVMKKANELFSEKIELLTINWVEALEKNAPLEGRVSLVIDPTKVCFYLNLKDNNYFIYNKKFNLKNFYLIYTPQDLQIKSQVLFQDHYYWLALNAKSMMSEGSVSLSESEFATTPLLMHWHRDKITGWSVDKVKGAFCGCELDLMRKEKKSKDHILEGVIVCDPDKMLPILNSKLKKSIEKLLLSGKYFLEGVFTINNLDIAKSCFTGKIYGKECQIKGVELAGFTTDIAYDGNQFNFTNFSLKDRAGKLSMNQCLIVPNKDSYHVYIDYAQLEDLRLARLKSPWTRWSPKNKPFFRHLYIPSFELKNIHGEISSLHSLSGSGQLQFINLPKKTFLSNLLFIPTEITARIGLDLSNLIPVCGTIEYDLYDGKIFLNRLEMYSDGKRSRFYLVEGHDAFIDFKGNLNMKIKMKQYNLLMKLAEFLTITVKGSLLHPIYTLKNHIANERPLHKLKQG